MDPTSLVITKTQIQYIIREHTKRVQKRLKYVRHSSIDQDAIESAKS